MGQRMHERADPVAGQIVEGAAGVAAVRPVLPEGHPQVLGAEVTAQTVRGLAVISTMFTDVQGGLPGERG